MASNYQINKQYINVHLIRQAVFFFLFTMCILLQFTLSLSLLTLLRTNYVDLELLL